jgi:hydrogenase maturation protease
MTLRVIGCGNENAGDDMVGLLLVDRLARSEIEGCVFRTITNPIDLLETVGHEGTVLIVDGVVGDAPPGTIHLMNLDVADDAPVHAISGHTIDLEAVVRLGRALGRPLPRLMLLGIEIASAEPGRLVSEAVLEAVDYCEKHFAELCASAEQGNELTVNAAIETVEAGAGR